MTNVSSVTPNTLAPFLRPEGFETLEQGGSWDLAGVALFTAIWLVAGLIVCRLTFRWIRKDS